ncbi:hypothetical protein [Mycolicibacterium goodii]|uniref:hypothetical protein n=1 Tax=Mycolicibacterium goodii TaxID=134601 RepID=UPI000C26AE9A|nr:hypothetical protein [Mycolicibacterium goodii]PJK24410.1 hypothetical protein CSX11_00660 [Mycolicibacterium goodii]
MSKNDPTLRAKYGMDEPPQPDHPLIGATQVVERTSGLVTRETGPTAHLFDPDWSPAMWQLATRTMRDMRHQFRDEIAAAGDSDTFLYYPACRGCSSTATAWSGSHT